MRRARPRPFRPKYAPEGMTWAQAKAEGKLRESEVWWIRYRDSAGREKRESTGSTDFQEAKRKLKEREAAVTRNEVIMPKANRATFAGLARDLRQHFEQNGRRLDTLEARLGHLEPFFGHRRAADLIPADLEAYKAHRLAETPTPAKGTINRELAVLGRAFVLGRRLGKLTVALDVAGHRFAEAPARSGFFEREHHDGVVRGLPDYAQPVAIAGYETGWRINELLSREWRHVDLEAGMMRLDPGETKNGDGRTVPLAGELLAVLRAQRARVRALEKALGRIVPHVFPYFSGRLRGRRVGDFGKAWATACKAAGAPGRIFHDYRRTAVRNLTRATVPTEVAMKLTGHRTRDVFGRYNIVTEADLLEAVVRRASYESSRKVSRKVAAAAGSSGVVAEAEVAD
jgi:integrase